MKSSLVVVGCGIKFLSHLTIESKVNIEKADKVFYLVNEPAMKEWIQKTSKNSESLDEIYFRYPLRSQSYQAITEHILQAVRSEQHVCVVLYGHPTVYATPGLDAVKQARKEGYYAIILPGISAEACLFADLLINPGSSGCQSFDTTDLLIRNRGLDQGCHVILWQISVIGMLDHPQAPVKEKNVNVLLDYLLRYYASDQAMALYSAAQYPGLEPKIQYIKLIDLPKTDFSRTTTLYIPPVIKTAGDPTMLRALEISSGN